MNPKKQPCPYRGRSETHRREEPHSPKPVIKCRLCGTTLEISEPNIFYWAYYHPNVGFIASKKQKPT